MPVDRRPFRIETGIEQDGEERELRTTNEHVDYSAMFARVFRELAEIRQLVHQGGGTPPPSDPRANAAMMAEVGSIQQAILNTKREILSLQVKGLKGDMSSRALDELDAVVSGTEVATETILSSAESIEETAGKLISNLQGDEQAQIVDIHKQAIKIFEACNFQDLTGQRISKVVQVLHFIEDRVESMMTIWGGAAGFSTIPDIDIATPPEKVGDAALLNGPPLETDVNVVSQDDIDSLFA
jgi:chemotaxis protein CheZ